MFSVRTKAGRIGRHGDDGDSVMMWPRLASADERLRVHGVAVVITLSMDSAQSCAAAGRVDHVRSGCSSSLALVIAMVIGRPSGPTRRTHRTSSVTQPRRAPRSRPAAPRSTTSSPRIASTRQGQFVLHLGRLGSSIATTPTSGRPGRPSGLSARASPQSEPAGRTSPRWNTPCR
jgi:hypothetical protein